MRAGIYMQSPLRGVKTRYYANLKKSLKIETTFLF